MSSFKEKAKSITASMTLDEKVSQMVHSARSISNLGIPAYTWWNECLHGVGGRELPDKRSEELTGKAVIIKDFSIPDLIDEQFE